MFPAIEALRSWSPARAVALALVAVSTAGCSADFSRLEEDPFRGRPEATSAISDSVGAPLLAQPRLVPPNDVGVAAAPDLSNSAVRMVAPQVSQASMQRDPRKDARAKISQRHDKTHGKVARAGSSPGHARLNAGDVTPVKKAASARRDGGPVIAQQPPAPPARTAAITTPAIATPAQTPTVDATKGTEATPRFRWPVRGQVIAGFGAKPDGVRNDGINVAVPENTPIKAADDGVVVYAGNELKGFGNLVLVRHADDYITAYAHAKELKVKRGDQIKGGEVIGISGQTGNVDAPQVHFEIRKGATPVNPMQFLHGA
jgi:hypothetical protein